jgi:ribonucleoside-diphosphate reductase alpha chain
VDKKKLIIKIFENNKLNLNDYKDDNGDVWQEYAVFHSKFEDYLKANGLNVDDVKRMPTNEIDEIIKKSPYHKATSGDIDWVKKVEMQGRIQRHIDHSISCTINLPENITEDIVANVYEAGWKSGCKGLTVYREGSRSGVLISQKSSAIDTHAPKRPKSLDAVVMFFQNNYEKWIAVVGMLDGRPYEIFTGKHESFFIPLYVNKGCVVKRKTDTGSIYDFTYIDKDGESITLPKLSRSFNSEYWNYAKLISGLLRHRMPMEHLVMLIETLDFKEDSINTWKNGVMRMLRKYIKDGTPLKDICPHCGAKIVVIEGCEKCQACGRYSKCG